MRQNLTLSALAELFRASLTLLPFDIIPFRFLEKLTVSFSSLGILSHMEGRDARWTVIERLLSYRYRMIT